MSTTARRAHALTHAALALGCHWSCRQGLVHRLACALAHAARSHGLVATGPHDWANILSHTHAWAHALGHTLAHAWRCTLARRMVSTRTVVPGTRSRPPMAVTFTVTLHLTVLACSTA